MLATRLADRRKHNSQSSDKAITRAKREVRSRISECVALALAASVEDILETGPVATIRRAQKHTHTMFHKRRRACTCDAAAHERSACAVRTRPPRPGPARDGKRRSFCFTECWLSSRGYSAAAPLCVIITGGVR